MSTASPGLQVGRLGTARFELAESPVWLSRSHELAFVDILAGTLHRWVLDGEDAIAIDSVPVGSALGAVAPASDDRFVAAVADGFVQVGAGGVAPLALVLADLPDQRMNDGKCDPYGAFVAGTTSWSGRGDESALYRLEPDGVARVLTRGLSTSNGLCWSADGRTLFHIDTPRRAVTVWDYDPAGPLTGPRRMIDLAGFSGVPDGMTIDVDGNLWIAFWGAGRVRALDPRGQVLTEIVTPAVQPTSCTFGGDDLATLFITSADHALGESATADDGGLFWCRPGTAGVPATPWTPVLSDAT
jgi:sugar lactone lactonase YvrE